MNNILIVSGHTDLNNSVANKKILEELNKSLPNAEIDYLSELYSDYKINVDEEQEKLLKADIIVLQYPIFWYSMPSLLEKWMEETFKHGFSHGSRGDKLKSKKVIVSITTGAPEDAYENIDKFLNPIKASCKLCQMEYIGNIVTYGVSYQIRNEKGKEIEEKTIDHANRLIEKINELKEVQI